MPQCQIWLCRVSCRIAVLNCRIPVANALFEPRKTRCILAPYVGLIPTILSFTCIFGCACHGGRLGGISEAGPETESFLPSCRMPDKSQPHKRPEQPLSHLSSSKTVAGAVKWVVLASADCDLSFSNQF